MKALVTGSSGFLGRHLCRELAKHEWSVTKVNSATPLDALWMKRQYDVIFHLASYTQAGDWCLTHSGDQWLMNQKINTDILDLWCRRARDAKLITIGSSCAYAPGTNLTEDEYMRGEPHESLYTYAMTKRMLYEGCRALSKQYGMKYLYLVPSTLYGPDYHTDGRQAHFIFDLIKKIIRGKELGEPVVLWGNGQQLREIIYVKDFIRFMLSLNEKCENDIFNVGAGNPGKISAYANDICSIVGYDQTKIVYDTRRYTGAEKKTLAIKKVKDRLGKYEETPLVDGLKETIKWFYDSGAWE